MKPIIRVENLGKQYRIGRRQEPYGTLRDSLTRAARAPFSRLRRAWGHSLAALRHRSNGSPATDNGQPATDKDRIWALKDVSFEIPAGAVTALIGHNGAGKSTLLKILSRITEPTAGAVDLYGRVGSLLEVGTGFHPELTGRENIYLNGAILGMRRREIARQFDEIVDFAEVERFIDTPVKRFSSGMYLRLAFAVAAHLETEILLVDEVLGVGDVQFQRKCFEKMRQVGRRGRTVVIVSHNLGAMRQICRDAIVLERGGIRFRGEINAAVDDYLDRVLPAAGVGGNGANGANGGAAHGEPLELPSFVIHQAGIEPVEAPVIKTFDPVRIRVRLTVREYVDVPNLYAAITTPENVRLAGFDLTDFAALSALNPGTTCDLGFELGSLPLLPGRYLLELCLMGARTAESLPQTIPFEVVDTPVYGPRQLGARQGLVAMNVSPIHEALSADGRPTAATRLAAGPGDPRWAQAAGPPQPTGNLKSGESPR